jgi:1-acyl-sn-glycerol-3-phosphate acyltransferase
VARDAAIRRRDPLEGVGNLQRAGEFISGPFFRNYFRLRPVHAQRVPDEGPVVLVANHESMWDVPLLVVASPRPVILMAKKELFKNRLATWFFTTLGGFPVDRSLKDLAAMKRALEVVRRGRVLGLFAEGQRFPGELRPFLPGAAWVGLSVGAPILPVAIRGTDRIWAERGGPYPRPVRVEVEFGEPIPLEREPDPRARRTRSVELTERLHAEVARMLGR